MAIEETVEYKGKSLLILGAGGHGKVVAEIATDLGFVKIDFLDDNSPEAIGSVQDLPELGRDYDYIFCGIGKNQLRKQLLEQIHNLPHKNKIPTLIHPTAYISRTAQIQPGTVVEPKAIVNAGSRIEEGCIISVGAIVDHDTHIGTCAHVNAGAIVKAGGSVADFEKLEAGSVVLGYEAARVGK